MSGLNITVKKMTEEILARHPVKAGLGLRFGDMSIDFETNDPALVDELAEYFQGFVTEPDGRADVSLTALESPELKIPTALTVKPPDPGKTKVKEEYVDCPDGRIVRKRLTGMVFLFGGPTNLAAGPCRTNSNQIVNFINSRLIQWDLDHDALLAHAAAVSLGERGLALAGFSGMGKSTLALHLMSHGLDFVSNDRLLIKRLDGKAVIRGVPKLPRINPGTALNNPDLTSVIPEDDLDVFARLDEDQIWDLEHKYDVYINQCFGPNRFRLEADLSVLGILNWRRSGQPIMVQRIDLAERLDLLAAVKKPPGLFFLPPAGEVEYRDQDYLDRLSDIPVFEITGGIDFPGAASACLERLSVL